MKSLVLLPIVDALYNIAKVKNMLWSVGYEKKRWHIKLICPYVRTKLNHLECICTVPLICRQKIATYLCKNRILIIVYHNFKEEKFDTMIERFMRCSWCSCKHGSFIKYKNLKEGNKILTTIASEMMTLVGTISYGWVYPAKGCRVTHVSYIPISQEGGL